MTTQKASCKDVFHYKKAVKALCEDKKGERKMLNKVLILFSLITGYSVFAETASVQNWTLKEITLNPHLGPFPEYIKINFTNENEDGKKRCFFFNSII